MGSYFPKTRGISFLWGILFLATGCGEEVSVERAGQHLGNMRLVHEKTIDLYLNPAPPFGAVYGIVPGKDNFTIVDHLTNQVFAYSLSGHFAGIIGQTGKGLGEYLSPKPMALAVDSAGNTYIYDTATGRLNKYNGQREFIADLNEGLRLGYIDRLLTDIEGNLLQLFSKDGIAMFSRVDGKTLEKEYSTSLTTQATDSIVIHMSNFAGYCYNSSTNRLYYLVPTDYRIKEIDVTSGEILGEFGIQPPGFRPLPEQYHGLGEMKDSEEMTPIRASTTFLLGGMFLVESRYLIIGHKNPDEDLWWCIYDLTPPGGWYTFDEKSVELLKNRQIYGGREQFLYFYTPPTEKELDTSNGHIELYSLSIETL
jgi:hypothetical protein